MELRWYFVHASMLRRGCVTRKRPRRNLKSATQQNKKGTKRTIVTRFVKFETTGSSPRPVYAKLIQIQVAGGDPFFTGFELKNKPASYENPTSVNRCGEYAYEIGVSAGGGTNVHSVILKN